MSPEGIAPSHLAKREVSVRSNFCRESRREISSRTSAKVQTWEPPPPRLPRKVAKRLNPIVDPRTRERLRAQLPSRGNLILIPAELRSAKSATALRSKPAKRIWENERQRRSCAARENEAARNEVYTRPRVERPPIGGDRSRARNIETSKRRNVAAVGSCVGTNSGLRKPPFLLANASRNPEEGYAGGMREEDRSVRPHAKSRA